MALDVKKLYVLSLIFVYYFQFTNKTTENMNYTFLPRS